MKQEAGEKFEILDAWCNFWNLHTYVDLTIKHQKSEHVELERDEKREENATCRLVCPILIAINLVFVGSKKIAKIYDKPILTG